MKESKNKRPLKGDFTVSNCYKVVFDQSNYYQCHFYRSRFNVIYETILMALNWIAAFLTNGNTLHHKRFINIFHSLK